MLHPLPARRDGEDPEVRDAEVRLVEPPPPRCLVGEELATKGGLSEPSPGDRHGAPVSFEEEVRNLPALRCIREAEAEDPIRLNPEAVGFTLDADLDLPSEGQAQVPGRPRSPREHFLGRDESHPLAAPAIHLEGHHDLGDRKRVVKEDPGEVPVLRVPPDAPPDLTLRLEDLHAAVPKGIDQGFGARGVPVKLHGRAIKIAVVEEELQAAERRLPAPI